MKRNNLLKAVFGLLTTSALCLTGCSGGIFTFFVYNYDNADKYTAGDREITDKITTINIDYVSGDVKFRGTDSYMVKYGFSREPERTPESNTSKLEDVKEASLFNTGMLASTAGVIACSAFS